MLSAYRNSPKYPYMHKILFYFFSNKVSLKVKLLSSFMVVALLLLTVGGVNFIFGQKTQKTFSNILSVNLAQERSIASMHNAIKDEIRLLSKLSLPGQAESTYSNVFSKIETLKKEYLEDEQRLESILDSSDKTALFKELTTTRKEVDNNVNEIISLFKKNANNPDRFKLVQLYYSELEELIEKMFDKTQKMTSLVKQDAEQSEKQAYSTAKNANNIIVITVIIGFLTALFLGITLSNYLNNNLTAVATELRNQANAMTQVSESLIADGMNVRQRTEQQLDSIEKNFLTTEKINSMVVKNSANAQTSTSKTQESQNAVNSVRNSIEKLTNSVSAMNGSTQGIVQHIITNQEQMGQIASLIKEISNKTQVINEIVFQTKLLSFNASVEAARAGEAGKGFSVVAEEVGQLAISSGKAADEIKTMLNKSVDSVEEMVRITKHKVEQLLNESKVNARLGDESAKELKDLFSIVQDGTGEILNCIEQINVATQEEEKGLTLIQNSFSELKMLATDNTKAALSLEEQAQSLKEQSETVNFAVVRLQEIVLSSKAS